MFLYKIYIYWLDYLHVQLCVYYTCTSTCSIQVPTAVSCVDAATVCGWNSMFHPSISSGVAFGGDMFWVSGFVVK